MRGEIMQKWLTFESFSFFREIGTFQRFRDRYEMLRAKVPTRCKQKQKRNESQFTDIERIFAERRHFHEISKLNREIFCESKAFF